jgi:hypothetical protein
MMTERQRQAGWAAGQVFNWVVVSVPPYMVRVVCLAPSESGAYRVAEAEHPGVPWAFASRRECHCHGRLECRYAHAALREVAKAIEAGAEPDVYGLLQSIGTPAAERFRAMRAMRAVLLGSPEPGPLAQVLEGLPAVEVAGACYHASQVALAASLGIGEMPAATAERDNGNVLLGA